MFKLPDKNDVLIQTFGPIIEKNLAPLFQEAREELLKKVVGEVPSNVIDYFNKELGWTYPKTKLFWEHFMKALIHSEE